MCCSEKKKLKLTSTDLLTLNNKEIFRKGRDMKIMQYVLQKKILKSTGEKYFSYFFVAVGFFVVYIC